MIAQSLARAEALAYLARDGITQSAWDGAAPIARKSEEPTAARIARLSRRERVDDGRIPSLPSMRADLSLVAS